MTDAEQEIRRAVGEYDAAVAAKDIAKVVALYAPDAVIFGTGGQIDRAEYRREWEECFALPGEVGIERRDLAIVGGGDIAFMRCHARLSGEWEDEQAWGRCTVCYQKIGGVWLVTHEHDSFPVDFGSGARISLSF